MKYWSDLEIDLLIDELSEAAIEAIEQAAGEAAREAVLSMLEREAALLRETQRLREEADKLKRQRTITGIVCFIGGLFIGVGGTLIIGGR